MKGHSIQARAEFRTCCCQGLRILPATFKSCPAQVNRNRDECAELHLLCQLESAPPMPVSHQQLVLFYRIDYVNRSLRLSMGDTVEFPDLAKPERKSLSIFLQKFHLSETHQSGVFTSKIECRVPARLLQDAKTLIWKRIEVLDIGYGQQLPVGIDQAIYHAITNTSSQIQIAAHLMHHRKC